jgi:hypothetical protein
MATIPLLSDEIPLVAAALEVINGNNEDVYGDFPDGSGAYVKGDQLFCSGEAAAELLYQIADAGEMDETHPTKMRIAKRMRDFGIRYSDGT